jgi:hypothetical protein
MLSAEDIIFINKNIFILINIFEKCILISKYQKYGYIKDVGY